ncbi:MAG: hypothetical protein LUH16_07015, partial [Clostridiales bacterium]|nr:hypothetical protein [Clostridiales bacterium]
MEKRYYPTLEQARQYEADYRTVPVTRTILSDRCTTIETLRILKSVSRHCFLLESLEDSGRWGRYTFLGLSAPAGVHLSGRGGPRAQRVRDEGGDPEPRGDHPSDRPGQPQPEDSRPAP